MADNPNETGEFVVLQKSEVSVSEDKRIIKFKVRSADEISLDQADPIHSVNIGECECHVKGSPTLSFVAVKSIKRPDKPPHFGVMVKGAFSLSGPGIQGYSEEYPYLLGCAEFFKKLKQNPKGQLQDQLLQPTSKTAENVTYATMFVFTFCKDRAAVFDDIRSLHTTYEGASEIQSEEVKSAMSLPDLIKPVLTELRKPFDMDWDKHHLNPKETQITDEKMTNCAICACRMFFTLASDDEKKKSMEGMGEVFGQLGLKDQMAGYLKAEL